MPERIVKLLPLLTYGLLGGYVLAWLVLLIACVRRRRFWPLLGDDGRTRWFWLATFVLANPILTAMYLWFGQLRPPDAQKVRVGAVPAGLAVVVVAVAGFFVNFPGVTHLWMVPLMGAVPKDPNRPAGLSAHAATIEARSSTNATTVTTSGSHARFACRSVAIILENDHPLVRLIGRGLRDALAETAFIENVELYADGRFPNDGHRRADVFIRLGAREIRVTPIPYAATLRAEIDCSAGVDPWRSVSSYQDGTDPSLLKFNWDATVQHASRTVGYESIRHALAAGDIAKQLAASLRKRLEEWREKHGPLPELPASLYGTYRSAELPAPLARLNCRRLCSYCGLLTHNETYWRFEAPRDEVPELLKRLCERMEAAGWRKLSCEERDLRMDHGPARIHVYRPADRTQTGWVVTGPGPAKPPVELYVHLRERFSETERRAALEGLLAEPAPTGTLLFVSQLFDQDQRRRMYELLEEKANRPLPVQIELIDHYLGRKDHDKAAAAIDRARVLLWSTPNEGEYRSKIDDAAKKLAKALGREQPKRGSHGIPPPTAQQFRDAGFREVSKDTAPFEVDVALDEPVTVFYRRSDGETAVVTVRVVRSHRDDCKPSSFLLQHLLCRGGMRMWGDSGGALGASGAWHARHESRDGREDLPIRFEAEQVPGKERFKVSVKVQGR